MDVMLQRHCAKYIYVVPEGLRELMSDISREVLRSQPEEIYSFIADYLDALLITRENARVAARLVESITEISTTIADLFIKTGMTRVHANDVAAIIQVAFKKSVLSKTAAKQQQQQPVSEAVDEANIITEIIDEANITPEQAEQAAIIIQNAYRNFKHRQERETDLLKGMVDWRVAARSTMRLYRKLNVTYEEANRAATLIKAAYKGYYTRRVMKRLLEESERVSEEAEKSVDEESYGAPVTSWDRFGEAEEAEVYEDIQEIKKEKAEVGAEAEEITEVEEDTETMVLHIVDNLLKCTIPDSTSTLPSGFTTPPPSEIETTTKGDEGETGQTTEASPTMIEILADDVSPEEVVSPIAETFEAEAPVTETADAGATSTNIEEAVTAEAPESPPTELTADVEEVLPPEADANETETDTEYNDTTASEMQTTDTDATTDEA